MESSDKFDDFMKALGVGMIKRKLANSVVPINEVKKINYNPRCSLQKHNFTRYSRRWRSWRTDCT